MRREAPFQPGDLRTVCVRWRDSVRIYDGWDTIEHYHEDDHSESAECSTVGWLVRDNEEGLIVCLSRSREGKFVADGMFIPRSAIIDITTMQAAP